jgi:hypothetical protein
METKFTKGMQYFNDIINKVEVGSEPYQLMILLKCKYIQDFKYITNENI